MCINTIYLKKYNIDVPCGKCGACIKRLISDYTLRCKVEAKHSKRSYFVTLTYEKDPLQIYKKDLQDYFKRMRRAGFKFSYFALGDYGDTYGRPHYHALIFVKGFFIPEYLHSLWISGRDQTRIRGFIHLRPMSEGRIQYVIKYGYLAKLDWDKNDKRNRPFFLMSRRPALGSQYFSKAMYNYHKRSDVWYYTDYRYKKPLPRYYRNKLFNKVQIESHRQQWAKDQIITKDQQIKDAGSYEKYIERVVAASDNFLTSLRKQKQLKNKLL